VEQEEKEKRRVDGKARDVGYRCLGTRTLKVTSRPMGIGCLKSTYEKH